MSEWTEKDLNELATAIAKKLGDDVKWEAPSIAEKTSKEMFDEFMKSRQKYLLNLPVAEIAYMFYLQGVADARFINDDVSIEEVTKIFEDNDFIENVQKWITMKNENVTPLPQNPIVEVVKKICPCGDCQAHQDLLCDGDENCTIDEVEKINIVDLIEKGKGAH